VHITSGECVGPMQRFDVSSVYDEGAIGLLLGATASPDSPASPAMPVSTNRLGLPRNPKKPRKARKHRYCFLLGSIGTLTLDFSKGSSTNSEAIDGKARKAALSAAFEQSAMVNVPELQSVVSEVLTAIHEAEKKRQG